MAKTKKSETRLSAIPIATKKSNVPVGHSKFGGHPDLPKSVAWPIGFDQAKEYRDEDSEKGPLAFIAQINLAEVKNEFAKKGMLYFFAIPCPDDLGDGRAVIFYDGDEPLARHTDTDYGWLEGKVDADLPLPEYALTLGKKGDGLTHLFGKGDYIQDDLEEGEDDDDEDADDDDDDDDEFAGMVLLLQLDGNQLGDALTYVCSDDGSIYFLIRPEKLAKRDFRGVAVTLQNT